MELFDTVFESIAFRVGFEVRREGGGRFVNPYPRDSESYHEFNDGWDLAEYLDNEQEQNAEQD